jgi:hypothetical protein
MSEIKYIFVLYNEGFDKRFINWGNTNDRQYILNRYRSFYNTDKIKEHNLYDLINYDYNNLKVKIICQIEDADPEYMYHYIQSLVDDPDENYFFRYVKKYEEGYYTKKQYDAEYSKNYSKEYYIKNKQKIQEYNREYQKYYKKYNLSDEQKEKNKIRCRKYYQLNKQQHKQTVKKYNDRIINCPSCNIELKIANFKYHKKKCQKLNIED